LVVLFSACFCFVLFSQGLPMPRLPSNSQSSYLILLGAGIISMHTVLCLANVNSLDFYLQLNEMILDIHPD
jgi:hypothetical protein